MIRHATGAHLPSQTYKGVITTGKDMWLPSFASLWAGKVERREDERGGAGLAFLAAGRVAARQGML